MAVKGYTTTLLVAQELGRTLTGDEDAQATGLIEEAEAYIDGTLHRAWLVVSPVVGERHVLVGPSVYLDNTPVTTVTSVTIRSTAIGAASTTLAAGVGYELLDPAAGLLTLSTYPLYDVVNGPAYSPGSIVTVGYTCTTPPPADIRRATTLLVARWMTPRFDPSSSAYESISVGQGDIAIKYKADVSTKGMPDQVAAILRSYRRLVFA